MSSTPQEVQTCFKTLVCVTDQKNCDRIISAGRGIADFFDTELVVINVAASSHSQDPESIEYLFSVASENRAQMAVCYSDNIAKTIINFIKENKVSHMLTGVPQEGNSVTTKIWNRFTHITFFVVEHNGELREIVRPVFEARKLPAQ